jgi:hypothetical protein
MPTVLLIHCDGANGSTTFTDVSPSAHALTATNGAVVSTAQVKFGTGAARTPNTNSSIGVTGISDFQFGSAPFTIECWAYLASASGTNGLLTEYVGSDGFFFGTIFGPLAFWYINASSALVQFTSSTTPTTGVWHHYAADRVAGGTLRIYIDGVVAASTSAPTFANSTQAVIIGNDATASRNWPGYIDEMRVTKGEAMYGGPFTPPTGPFGGATATQAVRVMVLA